MLRDDVGFATVYSRIYRGKFLTLSNQMSRYICKCIRMTIMLFYFQSNFQGICILYGKIDWEESVKFLLHGSSASNCNFPIYFCVFGIIFYGLMNGLYNIYAMCRSRKEPSIG